MGIPPPDEANGILVMRDQEYQSPGIMNENCWFDEAHRCVISLCEIKEHVDDSASENASSAQDVSIADIKAYEEKDSVQTSSSIWYMAIRLHWLDPISSSETSHQSSTRPVGPFGKYVPGTSFYNIKLSLDQQFLALQRSDMEVEILDISALDDASHRFGVMCKRSSRILGIIWSAKVLSFK